MKYLFQKRLIPKTAFGPIAFPLGQGIEKGQLQMEYEDQRD